MHGTDRRPQLLVIFIFLLPVGRGVSCPRLLIRGATCGGGLEGNDLPASSSFVQELDRFSFSIISSCRIGDKCLHGTLALLALFRSPFDSGEDDRGEVAGLSIGLSIREVSAGFDTSPELYGLLGSRRDGSDLLK